MKCQRCSATVGSRSSSSRTENARERSWHADSVECESSPQLFGEARSFVWPFLFNCARNLQSQRRRTGVSVPHDQNRNNQENTGTQTGRSLVFHRHPSTGTGVAHPSFFEGWDSTIASILWLPR